MKKRYLIIASLIIFFTAANSYAAPMNDEYSSAAKLGRGFVNVVTSPVEVIRGIDLTSKESNVGKGWTIGLVKGVAGAVVRFSTGLVDVVTFPFEWPNEDKAPMVEPKYAWQEWHGPYMATE